MPNAESRNVFVNSRQVKQRYGDASDMWVHRRSPELRSPWVGGPGALFFFEPPTLHVGRKESHSATPL